MLAALKRWRKFLGLSVLPSPADESPLIPVHRGKGPLSNTTHIRSIVQTCFDHAIQRLALDNKAEEIHQRIAELISLEKDLKQLSSLGLTFPTDDVEGKNCVCHLVSEHV